MSSYKKRKFNKTCNDRHEIILWKKLNKGNIDALGNLYDIYVDELFSYGIKISSDKSVVMDAIHDIFLNLFKYKGKLADVDNVKGYLFKSLKRSIYKKNKTKITPVENPELIHIISKESSCFPSHEEKLISLEHTSSLKEKLDEGLSLLTKNQRKIIQLRYIEEQTYEEIAEITNVSISSARTNVYRALKTLREE